LNRTDQGLLAIGETDTLVATIIPSNATNQNVSWSTSNEEVLTVSNGIVTAVGVGNATITVTTEDRRNITASRAYEVVRRRDPVTGVTIDSVTGTSQGEPIQIVGGTVTIMHHDNFTLRATVSPEDTDEAFVNRNATWTSRNSDVIFINNAGATIQTAPGETYVVVTTEDGGFQDSVKVIVNPIRVESIRFTITEDEMRINHVRTFVPIIEPSNASFQNITWSVEVLEGIEDTIVTVENGAVRGINEGKVNVIATATEGELGGTHSAQIEITVSGLAVSGVTLDTNAVELRVGNAHTFTRIIAPAGATDPTVVWTSSNPGILQLTPAGNNVTALASAVGVGTATVTVTTNDGGFIATATVTVLEGPPAGCGEDAIPNLGEVGFKTNTTWTIGNRIWSDVVVAEVCNKTDYYAATLVLGGQPPNDVATGFRSDCRTGSVGTPGEGFSFFSWCAMMTHRETLCPYPWRIPTTEDFRNVDRHFGGDGDAQRFNNSFLPWRPDDRMTQAESLALIEGLIADWGVRTVGHVQMSGGNPAEGVIMFGAGYTFAVNNQTSFYWHFGESSAINGFSTEVAYQINQGLSQGLVRPVFNRGKHTGNLIRCVRDN